MNRDLYREVYLRSDHWRAVRTAALERADYRCAVCNSPEHLDVHHRTYVRIGAEAPDDVTVLCRDCHQTFHAQGRLAPDLSEDDLNHRLHELPPAGALELERFMVRTSPKSDSEAA